MIFEFQKYGFTFKGIYNICKDICNNCISCVQKKRNYYKREPTKQLVFKKPLERILTDITELPFEIYGKNKKKYLLNFIDHFSKYAFAYLIDNKKADTILSILKILFSKISFPETFGTDNGSEFTNKKFRKYLEDNNVKLIHGKAYNPRSQGCIERFIELLK